MYTCTECAFLPHTLRKRQGRDFSKTHEPVQMNCRGWKSNTVLGTRKQDEWGQSQERSWQWGLLRSNPISPLTPLLQPKPQELATPGASGRGGAGGHKKQGFVKSLFEKLLDTPLIFDTPCSQVTALPTAPRRRQI